MQIRELELEILATTSTAAGSGRKIEIQMVKSVSHHIYSRRERTALVSAQQDFKSLHPQPQGADKDKYSTNTKRQSPHLQPQGADGNGALYLSNTNTTPTAAGSGQFDYIVPSYNYHHTYSRRERTSIVASFNDVRAPHLQPQGADT